MLIEAKFNIRVIPHSEQRYETVGDWWLDSSGVWQIRVSGLGDPNKENLIIIHEMNEIMIALATLPAEMTAEDLVRVADRFDKHYEATRPVGDDWSEPGYVPICPVYRPHMIASAIEHLVAMELGVNYNVYGDTVSALSQD